MVMVHQVLVVIMIALKIFSNHLKILKNKIQNVQMINLKKISQKYKIQETVLFKYQIIKCNLQIIKRKN